MLMSKKNLKSWSIQQLRLTLFIGNSPAELITSVWNLVSTVVAETDESRPREGFRRLAGMVDDDKLVEVMLGAGRIDVIWRPLAQTQINPHIFIGDSAKVIDQFSSVVNKLINGLEVPIYRIALGMHFVQPSKDKVDSYKLLAKLLPVDIDPVASKDFMYQINCPISFNQKGQCIELNRLMRWSAIEVRQFSAVSSAQQGLVSQISPNSNSYILCEVDNSSPAEPIAIMDKESLVGVYSKLVDLAYVSLQGNKS